MAARRRLSTHAHALRCSSSTAADDASASGAAESSSEASTLHPRWNEGWDAGRYSQAGNGFHRAEPNPHLVANVEQILPASAGGGGGRVLVPLCGKTVDMPFLTSSGASAVVGVEGSQRAVSEFFEENTPEGAGVEVTEVGGFAVHSSEADSDMELWLGDFFKLEPDTVGRFDAVWDRGAFVAIEPALRGEYGATVRGVLEPVRFCLPRCPENALAFNFVLLFTALSAGRPPTHEPTIVRAWVTYAV